MAPPPPPMMPPGGGAVAVPGNLASPGLRIVGGLIDFIILLVINGIIATILQKANWLAGIINFVADLAYFGYFWSSRGQSIGMMVFGVADPGQCVDESDRLVVVLEAISLGDLPALERPALERGEEGARFGLGERDAAFAGPAFPARELVHGRAFLRWSMRSAAGGCESYTSECSGSGVSVAALSR